MHRSELPGTELEDRPPALPAAAGTDEVQLPEEGVGPLFHRSYRVRIRDARLSPEELMDRLRADPDRVAPTEFASFQKVRGDEGRMDAGDEFVVRMPGPWDGPVRVVDVSPVSFRLVTLDGHLEAGQIEFRAGSEDGLLVFVVESWARSGDRVSHLLYDGLRMAKEVQLHMWVSFLERTVRLSGGRATGGIEVRTRRVDEVRPDSRALRHRNPERALAELRGRELNFDPAERAGFTLENGWHVDDLRRPLLAERPGPPEPGGTWERAQTLMRAYSVADPTTVRAYYDEDEPLAGRTMLLELRFLAFVVHAGVRVGEEYDEGRTVAGRRARVFGWNYRTLAGHIERGEMSYEVWKWLDTGETEFRIHAVSRASGDGPWWVRLGFRLFGRHEQLKFYRHACERMARLTVADA